MEPSAAPLPPPPPPPPPPTTPRAAASTSTAASSTAAAAARLLQPNPRIAPAARTSSRNALHEPAAGPAETVPNTHNTSPRRPQRRDKGKQPLKPAAGVEQKENLRVAIPERANNSPLVAPLHHNGVSVNSRHSHGLSWSSTTRDSVVDNLLFSLDNLSRPHLDQGADVSDPDFDRAKYMFPHPTNPTRPPQRARGHTYSSSLSSDYDRAIPSESTSTPSPSTKGRRSESVSISAPRPPTSTRVQPPPRKSHQSSRASPDTTKHLPNTRPVKSSHSRKESSDMGSLDLGYSQTIVSTTGRMGLGNRRSLSMDHMYSRPLMHGDSMIDRGRPVPSMHSKYESAIDAAPEPMIPAGPRKMENPTATGPVYVNNAQPPRSTLKKMTTQTDLRSTSHPIPSPPIPPEIRTQATDFVRANSMRGPVPAVPPPLPPDLSKPLPSPILAPGPSATVTSHISSTRDRPGFFRRVFGSASSRSPSGHPGRGGSLEYGDLAHAPPARTSSSQGSNAVPTATRQSSREHPPSTTTSTAPHPPLSLTKKPSSFFRRRKKSQSEVSLVAPPALPITTATVTAGTFRPAEPSPSVSSLRKVMDPFLSGGESEGGRARQQPRTPAPRLAQESSNEDSDNLDIFHSGYTPPPDASLGRRDPLSRSHVAGPKQQQSPEHPSNESPSAAKMKVRKRPPQALSPTTYMDNVGERSFLHDASSTNLPLVEAAPKVSPLPSYLPSENQSEQSLSGASTGDKIIAAQGGDGAGAGGETRQSSVGTLEDASVVQARDPSERPESKKNERLYLRPSADEERKVGEYGTLDLSPVIEQSRDGSQTNSVKSPAMLNTATSATFASALHSPVSESTRFHSATSLPLPSGHSEVPEPRKSGEALGLNLHLPPPTVVDDGAEYRERARKIFDGDEEDVTKPEAAAWLGERNTLSTRTLAAYMELFDFAGQNILHALRNLCGKLVLKGETQQFDRIITALSARWCACNANHGFKAQDVVHTITYSLVLLNTDLHLADIGEKMSRSAYVKNTLPTIRRVVADAAPGAFEDATVRPSSNKARPAFPWQDGSQSAAAGNGEAVSPAGSPAVERTSFEAPRPQLTKRLSSLRPGLDRKDSDNWPDSAGASGSNALVNQPWTGPMKAWELEIETVLKSFFASIRSDPLPLHGAPIAEPPLPAERNLSVATFTGGLKRSGSVVSKAPSENASFRSKPGLRSMTLGLPGKYNRSRPKLYPASTLASSRTSFDDGNSVWSPVQSSNLSKYSFSKTLASASMQSLGQHFSPTAVDLKHSIGFASALSQAMIREEYGGLGSPGLNSVSGDAESTSLSVPGGLLENEALALEGAPWAKEGLVKHKRYTEKKAKERSWSECFAVISKGKLTLFAFNTSSTTASKSHSTAAGLRKTLTKDRPGTARSVAAPAPPPTKVGGGDWMENAEQLDVFVLRQTIASTLPPPGYNANRPHVWALSLPSGAVHLFQVGTPEIAREFMDTANYWSARLSKEPLSGSVSNIEYGWSEAVINTALVDSSASQQRVEGSSPDRGVGSPQHSAANTPKLPPSSLATQHHGRSPNVGHAHMHSSSSSGHPRPSFQGSLRGSLEAGGFGPSGGGGRGGARLAGDKVALAEWHPPTQSMMASQLMEVDQLRALAAYVRGVEGELARHNELKGAIELAYTPRHQNAARALANWQRKSDYLLREIVKFQTYADSLAAAQRARERFEERQRGGSSAGKKADGQREEEDAGATPKIGTGVSAA